MATILKNSTATLAGTGWVGNAVPTTTDIAYIGSGAGGLNSIPDLGINYTASALQVATDFMGPTLNILSTSNTELYRIHNQNSASQRVDGVYALYVAAGKNLGMAQKLQLRGPNSAQATHRWFIGTGGSLILNPATNTGQYGDVEAGALGAGLAMRVVKEGPGYAYIARSTSAINTTGNLFLGGYTIRDGEIRLDGFSSANPLGTTVSGVTDSNTLIFDPDSVSAQPTLRFVVNQSAARTITNPVTVNTRGTITVDGAFVATMTGAASGSGTLTIARTSTGSVTWNNHISCPLNVTGLLTMGATYDLTGATLSGNGTIALQSDWGNAISADAPAFTGTVTGSFQFTRTGTQTFGGVIGAGSACDIVPGTICTFTGASLGRINAINATTARVTGSLSGSGTTVLINTSPRFELYGPSPVGGTVVPSGLTITSSGSTDALVGLYSEAVVAATINEDNTSSAVVLGGEDTSTCTYSGTLTGQATAPAALKIRTKGSLILSGSVTGGGAGRAISLNSDTGYSGTIKLTGNGFTASSPVTLSKGTLHLNRASAISLTGGLTVSNLATVACSSTGAYAAQLSGAITLNSGAIMQFGAP